MSDTMFMFVVCMLASIATIALLAGARARQQHGSDVLPTNTPPQPPTPPPPPPHNPAVKNNTPRAGRIRLWTRARQRRESQNLQRHEAMIRRTLPIHTNEAARQRPHSPHNDPRIDPRDN